MQQANSDTKFTSTVNNLFASNVPIYSIEHNDYPKEQRRTCHISPVGSLTSLLAKHQEESKDKPSTGPIIDKYKALQQKLQQKQEEHNQFIQQKIVQWNPEEDRHIDGDPHKTVFIGRLDYSTDEIELSNVFRDYGEIEKIRVVRDKNTSKSKGYGFILFKSEGDARLAHQKANGITIKGRRCVVDIERGRIVKNWKPSRLGGGLGGRFYEHPKKIVKFTRPSSDSKSSKGDFEKQQRELKANLENESYGPVQKRNQMFAPPTSYGRTLERERDHRGAAQGRPGNYQQHDRGHQQAYGARDGRQRYNGGGNSGYGGNGGNSYGRSQRY